MNYYLSSLIEIIEEATKKNEYDRFVRYAKIFGTSLKKIGEDGRTSSEDDRIFFEIIYEKNPNLFFEYLEKMEELAEKKDDLAFVLFYRFKECFVGGQNSYDDIGYYLAR